MEHIVSIFVYITIILFCTCACIVMVFATIGFFGHVFEALYQEFKK